MTPTLPTSYTGVIPVTGQRYSGPFPALLQGKECNTLRCKTCKIYCEGKAFNLRQASSKCQLLSTLSSYRRRHAGRGPAVALEECGGEGSAYETWQCRFSPTAAGLLIIQAGVRRVHAYMLKCNAISRPML